ncbi:trypsin-like serine peptidase [Flexibacterium corallicola]|uniref:trypsin-like serine peptidase n=1 Tax=Flexibacterium corallicola TaxID=3037259 RepID=UPI00286EE61A|nr:trypsin-like serine protease [Pseudovibrio sp. M1P-2-3]
MLYSLCKLAIALLSLLWVEAAYAQTNDPFPGLIGSKDNREILVGDKAPWNAVGRVNRAGYNRRSMCTGTLVAPDKVLTAAHCLYNPANGKVFPAGEVKFVAGLRRDVYSELGKGKCIILSPRYSYATSAKLSESASDVAVIVLQKPMETVAPFPLVKQGVQDQRLMSVGYTRERPYLLTADRQCKLLKKTKGVWLTNCYTNFGGSGGPVLGGDEGDHYLSAVMVAVNPHKFTVAVPSSVWKPLVERAQCRQSKPEGIQPD